MILVASGRLIPITSGTATSDGPGADDELNHAVRRQHGAGGRVLPDDRAAGEGVVLALAVQPRPEAELGELAAVPGPRSARERAEANGPW